MGRKPKRLLDFGCGSGQFTEQLGLELVAGQVYGSDFFPDPPSQQQIFSYLPMTALSLHRQSFDAVVALHVIEHDDDANGLLMQVGEMASPGGILAIEVPNIECIWARVFGKYWDAWYLPFHRHHFNRWTLRAAIERAGYEVLAIHAETVPTMGRTLRNLFGSRGELPWLLVGIAFHPLQKLGEWLSGEPSALRVIARKPLTHRAAG